MDVPRRRQLHKPYLLWNLYIIVLFGVLYLPLSEAYECAGCECVEDLDNSWDRTIVCERRDLDVIAQLPSGVLELKMERGHIPTLTNRSFVPLSSLQKLVIDFSRTAVVEREAFSGLNNLRELEIISNDISRLPEFVFQDLTRLEKLILSYNLLEELKPNVFAGLSSLRTLVLTKNSLKTLPENVLSHLPELRELVLDKNKLESLPSTVFHSNPFLSSVALQENKLTSIPSATFQFNSLLLKVNLSSNRLIVLPSELFNNSTSIEEVYLQNNPLTMIPDEIFAQHYQIKTISFENSKFVCDCMLTGFRTWASSMASQLQLTAVESGRCEEPAELKGQYLINIPITEFICTTTTSTTTMPTTTTAQLLTSIGATSGRSLNTKTPSATTGIDEMTKYIIIASCVGGAFIIAVIIGITMCCCKRKKHKPRQVKYILKPPTDLTKQGDKPAQNGVDAQSKLARDEKDNPAFHSNPYNNDLNYRPNIMPTETDLDEDLQLGYDNRMYNNQPDTPGQFYSADGGNDGMQFYNSLNKSIAGASIGRQQDTPVSMLHRATPINPSFQEPHSLPPYTATHRATPASPYKMAGTHAPYYDNSSYGTQLATVLNFDGRALPTDAFSAPGCPGYFNVYENDCNGKYSTGSADSGVHSNSPVQRARTPTDFSDHHISPNDQIGNDNSLKKTIKNETYV